MVGKLSESLEVLQEVWSGASQLVCRLATNEAVIELVANEGHDRSPVPRMSRGDSCMPISELSFRSQLLLKHDFLGAAQCSPDCPGNPRLYPQGLPFPQLLN